MFNYAINPTPEQAIRSIRGVLPARIFAALAFNGGNMGGPTIPVIQTLIGVHKDQVAVVNGLWVIFQAVSLATLGYVFSQLDVRENPVILAFLSAGFTLFAFGNSSAISRSQTLIAAAATRLREVALDPETEHLRALLVAYEAKSVTGLRIAHLSFTLVVVVGIWVPYLSR